MPLFDAGLSLETLFTSSQRVEAELNSLEAKKLNLFNEHQRQCDEISNLHTEIDCLQSVLGKLRHEEATLNQWKERTENFVKNLRKGNEICVKFKQMVKQEIENNILSSSLEVY